MGSRHSGYEERLKRKPPGCDPPGGRALLLCCLILVSGINCKSEEKSREINVPGSLETRVLFLENSQGVRIPLTVELARTGTERTRGLMNREALPEGAGMLFIFDRDEVLNFWMKDTSIPLSIAYISSGGRIIEIFDMQPRDLTGISSSRSVRYALEAPQGWFGRVGIGPGDYLHLPW